MRRVVVICEGQTEEQFVGRVMAPSFFERGLYLQGITLPTSPGHKGGALSAERFLGNVSRALSQPSTHAVTSLIDLYRLDGEFPGYSTRPNAPLAQTLAHLESALHAQVVQRTGCQPARFLAHIQPHEFEALLFSHVPSFAAVNPDWQTCLAPLHSACAQGETPEHINHGPATHPSARLEAGLPGYRKARHGPLVAGQVGLARMVAACPHFAAWVARLRLL